MTHVLKERLGFRLGLDRWCFGSRLEDFIQAVGLRIMTTLTAPERQTTSDPHARSSRARSERLTASSHERYRPPHIISWLCETGPPVTRIRAPIPRVLGGTPRNRTAIRGADVLLR
jgi:hypothetical protein